MANAQRPRVEDNINGFDTYFSIDADDAALYDGFTNNRTRNAFLSFMRKVIANRRKDLRGRNTGASIGRLWTARRNHWLGKTDNGRQPAATAVAPGAVAPVPLPALPPVAPSGPAPPVVPVAVPPTLPEADDNDASAASSKVSSGERSPTFFLQNDPERKRFLAPTAGQRKDFYDDNGRWKFAMTLHQTRLDDGKRRFSQGSMPRKSVYLCVRTNSTGEIQERITVKCLEAITDTERQAAEHEILMNKRISSLNCSHMITYHGSSHRKSTNRFRNRHNDQNSERDLYNIYTSFADLGTLARVHRGHAKTPQKAVPEHFIWYFLSQATDALLALQRGTCLSPNAEPQKQDETWRPIVHSDIKDANIFLRSNNNMYPAYPDVVVSDFDVAFEQDNPRDVDDRRYQGTPGMQPPERENSTQVKHDWKPAYWDVSEKSDVWSLAMTAWALMVAHKESEETFYKRAKERTDDWYSNEKLREGNVGEDGVFPTTLEDLPKEYSVRLCKLVSSCLRYRPKKRPSLDRLRKDIGNNLSKLDRMYGDEIHKPGDAIAKDFKLELSKDDSEEWELYAPGKKHFSFRKRRKRANTGALDGKLTDLVAYWESKTRDAQSSAMAQGRVLDLVDGVVNSSPDDEVKALREHEPHLIAWRFLFSSMRKRTSSEASVYNTTQNTEGVLRETFQSDTKRAVLAKLRDTIIPIAIRTAEPDAHEDADNTTDIKSFETLKHAMEWGLVLLDIGGEPRTPRLRGKTEMHRGMLDFLFDQPFDLFSPGKSGSDEADADVSDFSGS